jgi:hypothetical protein
VLPFDEETGLSDFEELCQQQSDGPKLNKADEEMLVWLMVNADAIEDEARYIKPRSSSRVTKARRGASCWPSSISTYELVARWRFSISFLVR